MDLYSASKRLSRPFIVEHDIRTQRWPIGARGLIGDGLTAATIRVDGVIDWLCMPRFDSPSVFGALVDPQRGGLSAVAPIARPFESLQRYDPGTNVLETLFRVPGEGVVRLTDFMPWTGDPRASIHEVHRRVQCVEGSVRLRAAFDPRFGYAIGDTELSIERQGVMARGPSGERLVAVLGNHSSGPWERDPDGGVKCDFELKAGERRWMVLSWDAPQPEPIAAYRPFEHLRTTRHAWREWTRKIRYDGPWRHHVLRSALLLKLLIYAPTGGMVAAPTTSLPEWIGGVRNWDYRYVWTRDSAMSVRAANLIGCTDEAREFFHFVRDTLDRNQDLGVMYTVDGCEVPTERILEHMSGFENSAPVRIGNGARSQVQLDTAGALVDAAWLYERFGGSLPLRTWRCIRGVLDDLMSRWQFPDDGIWEPRGHRRNNVHSKLMCWLAFDRAARLAPRFGDDEAARRWSDESTRIHEEILARGLDASGKHFKAAYELDRADGALLLMPIHGFFEADHPLMVRTVERVQAELGDGPFVHRYKVDDGVGGPEGAFLLCGFWLAETLAMSGRIDQAQEVFVAHAEASNHLGLLAEEIDPSSGDLLGNFPQAFSHLGLINAATRIDLALRMRDEGVHRVPHLTDRVFDL